MSEPVAIPAVPLNYATHEGVPAHWLGRVLVLAVTVASVLQVVGALVSIAGYLSIQGLSFVSVLPYWGASLLANLPVSIIGTLSLARRQIGSSLIVALWIEIVLRLLGAFITAAVYFVSIIGAGVASGAGGVARYSTISVFSGAITSFAWIVLPLAAIVIWRRPEMRP